jgi:hypothetical protein
MTTKPADTTSGIQLLLDTVRKPVPAPQPAPPTPSPRPTS